jgi:hypothetical protein
MNVNRLFWQRELVKTAVLGLPVFLCLFNSNCVFGPWWLELVNLHGYSTESMKANGSGNRSEDS